MSSHWERRPKSVEARNQRYLPLASNTGYIAAASPSVTWCDSPVSTSATKIARNREFKWAAYATQRESGLQVGNIVRVGTIQGSLPTCFALPLATSTTHTR